MSETSRSSNNVVRLITLIVSCFLAAGVIQYLFSDRKDFSDFDLGAYTFPVFARVGSTSIHFSVPHAEEEASMLKELRASAKPPLLVLGNSQTHGVNRYEEGQDNLVDILHRDINDYYVFAHTLPNANLQELFVVFRHWLREAKPKMVVIPAFFDDVREDNLRPDLVAYADISSEIRNGNELTENLANQLDAMRAAPSIEKAVQATAGPALYVSLQERSEALLDGKLSSSFPIWRKRPSVRGEMFLYLYYLRNTVLGLSSQSARPILPGPLKRNLGALEQLLATAEADGIATLVYIPPLRQDVPPPYNMQEYANFKAQLNDMVSSYHKATLVDLDNIIPGDLWGMKESTNLSGKPEYDFMHFSSTGHKILAEKLMVEIAKLKR